jgi:hypothetical protein
MDLSASLKCIDKQLRQSTKFSNIKHALCPSTPAPLTQVHITTTEQVIDPISGAISSRKSIEIIDTRAKLEARILARNKTHFAQAEGTSFTEELLLSMTPDTNLDD